MYIVARPTKGLMLKTCHCKLTLRMDGSIKLGPLEEKEAINGAGFAPNSVFTGVIYAVGFLVYVHKQIARMKHLKEIKVKL